MPHERISLASPLGRPMTRVFLVDDHEIVRRGLADLINAEPDLEVVGEAATRRQAVARVAATRPDIAILDVRLPDGSGLDVCRDIRTKDPGIRCLILTAFDDDEASRAAVLAGASGYVLKDIRGDRLLEGIRRVARGETLLAESVARQVVTSLGRGRDEESARALTARERQVLDLISAGLTNRQIGERLDLAEKTVKNYVSGLLSKLGMERRTQAAVFGADLHRRELGAATRNSPGLSRYAGRMKPNRVTPVRPGPGQESVWEYPRPPRVERSSDRVVVTFDGQVIVDSDDVIRVLETSHPPVYYLPRSAFRAGSLEPAPGRSYCEYKGEASYLNVVAPGRREEAAAWYYPSPTRGYEDLAGRVALYPGRMDLCTVNGEQVQPQPGRFYGGWITSRVVGPFKGAPGSLGW